MESTVQRDRAVEYDRDGTREYSLSGALLPVLSALLFFIILHFQELRGVTEAHC